MQYQTKATSEHIMVCTEVFEGKKEWREKSSCRGGGDGEMEVGRRHPVASETSEFPHASHKSGAVRMVVRSPY